MPLDEAEAPDEPTPLDEPAPPEELLDDDPPKPPSAWKPASNDPPSYGPTNPDEVPTPEELPEAAVPLDDELLDPPPPEDEDMVFASPPPTAAAASPLPGTSPLLQQGGIGCGLSEQP
jgi:hypothetical protein